MFIKKDFDLCRIDLEYKDLPGSIFFIGDVHKGSPDHAEDAWRKTLRRIKATKNAFIVGMGDYVEMCSESEKKILASGLHESTENVLDELADRHVRDFIADIKGTGARVIALLEGNHYWQYQTGETSTMRMARELGCPYLGSWLGVIGLFLTARGRSCAKHIDIVVHHGKGAGKRPGGSVNNVDDMLMLFEADVYAMGHDHQCFAFPKNRLVPVWGHKTGASVKARPQMLLRTGSFLRSYNPGGKGYLVRRAVPPAHLGCIKLDVKIAPRKSHTGVKEFEFEAVAI